MNLRDYESFNPQLHACCDKLIGEITEKSIAPKSFIVEQYPMEAQGNQVKLVSDKKQVVAAWTFKKEEAALLVAHYYNHVFRKE